MGKITDLSGAPLDTTLTAAEKEHHSERVMRRRRALDQSFEELTLQWGQDNAAAPHGTTIPNEAAIDRKYDELWRQQCRVAENANEAVVPQPERMKEWIQEQRDKLRREELWYTPLHKINSLDEFSFRLVGQSERGPLWLNSAIALVVQENGMVEGYIALSNGPKRWANLLRQVDANHSLYMGFTTHRLFALVDYTPKELFGLLSALRTDKITHPTEYELQLARGSAEPLPRDRPELPERAPSKTH